MCAPFSTRSGYGDHARSIYYSIMDRDDIDIKCLDVRWGTTPRNHLNPKVPRHKKLLDCFVDFEELKQQPDVYIDIRIPNEFANPGKFNIGITAGVETDVVSPEFLAGMNNMNLNIVPSRFTATTFSKCTYDQVEDMPDGQKQKTGDIKLDKPIEVLFEGADTDVYHPMDKYEIKSDFTNELTELIKEDFAYLHVGQWTKGDFGEDRKNIPLMIKCFLETFSNVPNPPALVLKISGANFSILDNHQTVKGLNKIKEKFLHVESLPNIYLVHGDLTIQEMAILYNHPKIRAFITCTHGEGFGRPMLEACFSEKPIIAPDWSGQKDFLNKNNAILLPGTLMDVHKSAVPGDMLQEGAQWFAVNYQYASQMMLKVFKEYKKYTLPAKRLAISNRGSFSLKGMNKKFEEILDKYLPKFEAAPQAVNLKLPKLKKIGGTNSDKPKKMKLPTLKKVNHGK